MLCVLKLRQPLTQRTVDHIGFSLLFSFSENKEVPRNPD